MNKPLLRNIYAAIAALLIAMFALPQQAQAQLVYICSKMYADDATIPLGGGTAKWNHATATLTLNNVKVENFDGFFFQDANIPNLKIVLVGENTVSATGKIVGSLAKNIEISGTGSLVARSNSQTAITQINREPSTLIIKDCTLDVQGKHNSISGYRNGENTETLTLVVDNATVKVKGATGGWGWKASGIYGIKHYHLKNCYISTPGVKFGKTNKQSYYEFVGTDGGTYYGEVTIEPATTYNLYIAGTQVTSGNCADLSTIHGISGTANYDPGTHTLTLNNATINTTAEDDGGIGIGNYIDGLTLRLIGESTITTENNGGILNGKGVALTITGNGKLTVNGSTTASDEGSRYGIFNYGTVTVSNCTLEAVGGKYGFSEGHWKFNHCNIRVKGSGAVNGSYAGSLCNMWKEPEFNGCEITSPTGTYWKPYITRVAYSLFGTDDKIVTDWVVITKDATGIEGVKADVPQKKRGIYTLGGVRLSGELKDLPKGVYIIDGEKVVKK